MKNRPFGRLGRNVSEIGFGSWGIGGGQWVEVEEEPGAGGARCST